MRAVTLLVILALPGCILGWAFVDASNDAAHAKNDAPRCAAYCKMQGAETSFESPSTRECGCQLGNGTFVYSPWPQ